MKKVLTGAMLLALIAGWGATAAAEEDMSWWGNTGATPEPVQDATRSGYWWWPTQPASNVDDGEVWGNAGIVYGMWCKAEEKPEPAPPAPPAPPKPEPAPAPKVTRSWPVDAKVLFDFDRAVIRSDEVDELNIIADELKKHAKDTLTVEGHTCDIGAEAYNMDLGQRRADAVKKYLADAGVDAGRITAVSKGEAEPAVPNTSAGNRKLNRRVVFLLDMVDE